MTQAENRVDQSPMHFIVRFEPRPGCEDACREALGAIVEPSRAEPGCSSFQVFESVRAPVTFAIHSTWVDEAAFDTHARLPHTVRFIATVEPLLTHPVRGQRLRCISRGPGAVP
jgi:quinol monooxygenase YgiN